MDEAEADTCLSHDMTAVERCYTVCDLADDAPLGWARRTFMHNIRKVRSLDDRTQLICLAIEFDLCESWLLDETVSQLMKRRTFVHRLAAAEYLHQLGRQAQAVTVFDHAVSKTRCVDGLLEGVRIATHVLGDPHRADALAYRAMDDCKCLNHWYEILEFWAERKNKRMAVQAFDALWALSRTQFEKLDHLGMIIHIDPHMVAEHLPQLAVDVMHATELSMTVELWCACGRFADASDAAHRLAQTGQGFDDVYTAADALRGGRDGRAMAKVLMEQASRIARHPNEYAHIVIFWIDMNEPFAERTFADLENRCTSLGELAEFAATLAHIRTPWIRTRLKALEQRLIKTPVEAEDIALVAECLADFVQVQLTSVSALLTFIEQNGHRIDNAIDRLAVSYRLRENVILKHNHTAIQLRGALMADGVEQDNRSRRPPL